MSKATATKKKSRAIGKILNTVLDPISTKEQQVFALREAMLHPNLWAVCSSAGVILDASFVVDQYLIQNIKQVIKLLAETQNSKGRTTDDKRSVVHSIVLACLPSPNLQGKQPSDRAVADASIGLHWSTYRRIVKGVTPKRASLESNEDNKETVHSQVLKSKGKNKV